MFETQFEKAANYDDALLKAADECGIYREFWDILQQRHEPTSDVRRRILQSLGFDVGSQESLDRQRFQQFEEDAASALPKTAVISVSDPVVPLTLPENLAGSVQFEIALEDGEHLQGSLETSQLSPIEKLMAGERRWTRYQLPLPNETPLGYHKLQVSVNDEILAEANLIVCPDRAYLPDELTKDGRTAGFNISLYGLRSQRNWGCGDFTDLRHLLDWAHKEAGFSFVGLNPLHALHNRVPYNTSPYLPLSIYYKNWLYIDIEGVREFAESACAQGLLRSASVQEKLRFLRGAEFVEYSEIDKLKRRFLKVLFREFLRRRTKNPERAKAFADYCEAEGDLLHKFALYCALDEALHKQDRNRWTWQDWPLEYQSPDSDACRKFVKEHARSVEFYKYIQFILEEQLRETHEHAKQIGMPIGLYHDLAVATDNCGSDLWAHRKFYVGGCRVGSPPDDFSPTGQDWAFPPPNTLAHRHNGYRLYRESIRKIVKLGGALRIDHVMRLFRLFWIPDGYTPADGIYVQDNATDLLRILALESVRSKNVVIGEDLGTVTDEMRDTLARFGILSYRLFFFEKNHKTKAFKKSYEYPRQALVASSTHDLPTIAGFWKFRDIEARKAAGLVDENGYWSQVEDRKQEKQRMLDVLHEEGLLPHWYTRDAAQVPEVDGDLHNAIVGYLAQVPSMILLLNQEDFTKETEQQNLPGSTAQYPNWQRKMKATVEELNSPVWSPFAAMFCHQLAHTGRAPSQARTTSQSTSHSRR
ncbi:MAG: 4-alpha-glucanotransferase [Acidobacteriaceae bacterium]|nr:4-alpha-glucanotransferase [Acidobacteriaceae bacterium]